MKNIFVGNLNSSTSEDALRKLFVAFGPVNRVKIIMDNYTGKSRPHLGGLSRLLLIGYAEEPVASFGSGPDSQSRSGKAVHHADARCVVTNH